MNTAVAERPLVWPVAFTTWAPGVAVVGTFTDFANSPPAVVVVVPTVVEPNLMVTDSLDPNPEPVTETFVMGGPCEGERWMDGEAPSAGAAIEATTSPRATRTRRTTLRRCTLLPLPWAMDVWRGQTLPGVDRPMRPHGPGEPTDVRKVPDGLSQGPTTTRPLTG